MEEKFTPGIDLLENVIKVRQLPCSIKRENTNDSNTQWINKDYSGVNKMSSKIENSAYYSDDNERQYLHYY